jgi:hypothetical protein
MKGVSKIASLIFSTETKTTTRPRHDATVRIQYFGPDDTKWGGQWRTVQLFEFHPDYDNRSKFRSYAYTSIPDDIIQNGRYHTGVYSIRGQGYLEKPYLDIRELSIHEADLRELMDYCRAQPHPAMPIVIHPCPLPFPMFAEGDRVTVIGKDTHGDEGHIGQTGTIAKESSGGGMSMVRFDNDEYNRGTDGRIYKAIGMPSISLRKLEQGEHLQVVMSRRKHQRKAGQAEGEASI